MNLTKVRIFSENKNLPNSLLSSILVLEWNSCVKNIINDLVWDEIEDQKRLLVDKRSLNPKLPEKLTTEVLVF